MPEKSSMLSDHSGKRSVSRATSLLATITLCAVALIGVVGGGEEPSLELLAILAAVAIGPIGLNRFFGEESAAMLAVGVERHTNGHENGRG